MSRQRHRSRSGADDGNDDQSSNQWGCSFETLSDDLQNLHKALEKKFSRLSTLTQLLHKLQQDDVTSCEMIHEMCPEDFSRLGISCGHRILIARAVKDIVDATGVSEGTTPTLLPATASSNFSSRGAPAARVEPTRAKHSSAPPALFRKPNSGKKVQATVSLAHRQGSQEGMTNSNHLSSTDGVEENSEADEEFTMPSEDAGQPQKRLTLENVGRHAATTAASGFDIKASSATDRDEDALDTLGSSFASLMEYVETSHAFTKTRFSNTDSTRVLPNSLHMSNQKSSFEKPSVESSQVRWEEMSGYCTTLKEFLLSMRDVREQAGFPSLFDRLFYDNKPMPFVEISATKDMVALLLRIPDLSDEDGTSIATITNRVCFMVSFSERLVVTYHACENDPFKSFQREWESGQHEKSKIEKIVRTMIRRVLHTYSEGLAGLQSKLDDLDNQGVRSEETLKVQTLSTLQKKAAVYRRCAAASQEALMALQHVPALSSYVGPLADSLDIVISVADELVSNALSSIDLTIALSEFKSNANLKIFTYITILLQPVTLATSWYGMNFVNMPELDMEMAYFVFIPVVWGLALMIFALFLWREFGVTLFGPLALLVGEVRERVLLFSMPQSAPSLSPSKNNPLERVDCGEHALDVEAVNESSDARSTKKALRRVSNVLDAASEIRNTLRRGQAIDT